MEHDLVAFSAHRGGGFGDDLAGGIPEGEDIRKSAPPVGGGQLQPGAKPAQLQRQLLELHAGRRSLGGVSDRPPVRALG